jgi:hypothetical protein
MVCKQYTFARYVNAYGTARFQLPQRWTCLHPHMDYFAATGAAGLAGSGMTRDCRPNLAQTK